MQGGEIGDAVEPAAEKVQLFDAVRDLLQLNTNERLVVAVSVAAGIIVLLLVSRAVLVGRLSSLAKKTKNQLDDLVVELVRRTHFLFFLFMASYVGSRFLFYPEGTEAIGSAFGHLLVLSFLLQLALWGNASIAFWLRRPADPEKADPAAATTLGALGFVARLLIWAVVVLLGLANLGVDITALVTGLGIGGIALALAVQNILGDLLASASIILDKPFQVGDYIVVGDLSGTVTHIGLKTTRVKSLSGEQLIFANSDLLGSRIRNYKGMSDRRAVFSFGVTYDTPREKLARIPSMIKEIIARQQTARFDRAHFKTFGDFSLNFEVVYIMTIPDYAAYMDTQEAINLDLCEKFEGEGIEFAFPTQTILLEPPDGAKG